MNNKDIILDFTSLLDVILIILFFFIMFSSMESDTKTKTAMAKAQAISDEAEYKLAEAEELKAQAEQELAELMDANERQGQDISAIFEFSKGQNLKFLLKPDGKSWTVYVKKGEAEAGSFDVYDDELQTKIEQLVEAAGISADDTFLCELIYDASLAGSRNSYRVISGVFDRLKVKYTHFFLSETDTSV